MVSTIFSGFLAASPESSEKDMLILKQLVHGNSNNGGKSTKANNKAADKH